MVNNVASIPHETMPDPAKLLETRHLSKEFKGRKTLLNPHPKSVKAVADVSLTLKRNEVLGLVGESGCGKSTLGRTILRLIPATGGEVIYDGSNILTYGKEQMRQLRRRMQIIFQDIYASLNPRMTVEELIRAPLDVYAVGSKAERRQKVLRIIDDVGLAKQHLMRFPHEFSGGQRQRIGFARALIIEPELVVCDEPVSALDVSVRAQILNLMKRMQEKKGLSYLFISHDLSVVKHISDRIAVMYLGHIVELTGSNTLYERPLHPYTVALLSAIPLPDPVTKRRRIILAGDLPNPYDPPTGCPFHTRCPKVQAVCRAENPPLCEKEPGHFVACHFPGDTR